jgi:hypothetical protein
MSADWHGADEAGTEFPQKRHQEADHDQQRYRGERPVRQALIEGDAEDDL